MAKLSVTVEIVEGNGGKEKGKLSEQTMIKEGICAWMHWNGYRVGSKFDYPREAGQLCPWLIPVVHHVVHILACGGTLPWTYPGTPYEKEVNVDGKTTEFIRCIDPTKAGIVVKITAYRANDR